MPKTGLWVLLAALCCAAAAPEVLSLPPKDSILASSQNFDGRHKVTTATSFQNTVFKRNPVAHRSPNDARMRFHRQAKSDADITVKGKVAGSRLTRIIDACMEKGQKLVRMENNAKDIADHRMISFCDNQKKPSVANVNAGRKVLECAVTDLAKDVREIVDLLPELTKTAINFPEKSLKGVLCDPSLIQLNLAAIAAKMVQRICEECEIGQQNVPQQIIHALGGVDSLGNPLRTEVEKAAEIVEKVSEIITYEDFKNRYLDPKKYKRVVKWAGYGSDYVDTKALKKAIKRRIKESFLNETLHIAHVVPDGVGVVVDAIGELQKELKTTIDVGGVTSWFSTKLLIQNWSTVRQRFAIFVRSALGLGDRTLVLDAKSRITYPADIIIAAAAKGIEAHFVAYEGGDHTKMDIARLLDKIVANEKNPDISMKNVNLEFHVGWEKKSTDASRDAATKLCEFASAYWKPRLKVYSYASEVKDGKVEPTSQCPKPKTDIEPPYSVVFDEQYEAVYLSSEKFKQLNEKFVVSQFLTIQQLQNRYFKEPYTNAVIWLGSLSPYKDHDFPLPLSINERILNTKQLYASFSNINVNTIHFVVANPAGIGKAATVLSSLKTSRKLGSNVLIVGLIFVADITDHMINSVAGWISGFDAALIFTPNAGDNTGDRYSPTFFSRVAIASAESGMKTTLIAYEGGDYAVDDLKSIFNSYQLNRANLQSLSAEFHTGWERDKSYGDSASKVCKEAQSLFGTKQFRAITRATEAKKIQATDVKMTHEYGDDGCPSKEYQTVWPAYMAEGSRKCKECFVADSDYDNRPTALTVNEHTCKLIHARLGRSWDYREFKKEHYNPKKFKKVVHWMGFSADYSENVLFKKSIEERILKDFAVDTVHIGAPNPGGIGDIIDIFYDLKKAGKTRNCVYGGTWTLGALKAWPVTDAWPQQDFVLIFRALSEDPNMEWSMTYDLTTGNNYWEEVVIDAAAAGLEAYQIIEEGGMLAGESMTHLVNRVAAIKASQGKPDSSGKLKKQDIEASKAIMANIKVELQIGWQKWFPDKYINAATDIAPTARATIPEKTTIVYLDDGPPAAVNSTNATTPVEIFGFRRTTLRHVCGVKCKAIECYDERTCICSDESKPPAPCQKYCTEQHQMRSHIFEAIDPSPRTTFCKCSWYKEDVLKARFEPINQRSCNLDRASPESAKASARDIDRIAPIHPIAPEPRRLQNGSIFVSYCHANKDIIVPLCDLLIKDGYSVWHDTRHTTGGILQSMANAADGASLVLFALSENYFNSYHSQNEVDHIFREGIPRLSLNVAEYFSISSEAESSELISLTTSESVRTQFPRIRGAIEVMAKKKGVHLGRGELSETEYAQMKQSMNIPDLKTGHIFLSYSEPEEDVMRKLSARLTSEGYNVWKNDGKSSSGSKGIDVDAIRQAVLVIYGISEATFHNRDRQNEAEQIYKLKIPRIPIQVGPDEYLPIGWLGYLTGSRLFFNASSAEDLAESFSQIHVDARRALARSGLDASGPAPIISRKRKVTYSGQLIMTPNLADQRKTMTEEPTRGHIYLSYAQENKEVMEDLAKKLNEANYRVWSQSDELGEGELQRRAVAIDDAVLVFFGLSDHYFKGWDTENDGEYIYMQRKLRIPINVGGANYTAKNWLAFLVGSHEVFVANSALELQKHWPDILKETERRLRNDRMDAKKEIMDFIRAEKPRFTLTDREKLFLEKLMGQLTGNRDRPPETDFYAPNSDIDGVWRILDLLKDKKVDVQSLSLFDIAKFETKNVASSIRVYVLKAMIALLVSPPIPADIYGEIRAIAKITCKPEVIAHQAGYYVHKHLQKQPAKFKFLKQIIGHLRSVVFLTGVNKMSSDSLSTAFGPVLFKDSAGSKLEREPAKQFIQALMHQFDKIFKPHEVATPAAFPRPKVHLELSQDLITLKAQLAKSKNAALRQAAVEAIADAAIARCSRRSTAKQLCDQQAALSDPQGFVNANAAFFRCVYRIANVAGLDTKQSSMAGCQASPTAKQPTTTKPCKYNLALKIFGAVCASTPGLQERQTLEKLFDFPTAKQNGFDFEFLNWRSGDEKDSAKGAAANHGGTEANGPAKSALKNHKT